MARKTGKDLRMELDAQVVKQKKEYGGYDKWEVDSWAETLTKAAEIISDPKKMKAVAKCLEAKGKALETLRGFTASSPKESK